LNEEPKQRERKNQTDESSMDGLGRKRSWGGGRGGGGHAVPVVEVNAVEELDSPAEKCESSCGKKKKRERWGEGGRQGSNCQGARLSNGGWSGDDERATQRARIRKVRGESEEEAAFPKEKLKRKGKWITTAAAHNGGRNGDTSSPPSRRRAVREEET
jgi:hypothetical protein